MRIGIDVRKISDTGIGRYIDNLVSNLARIDDQNEYVLFFATADMDRYIYTSDRIKKVEERAEKYSLMEHMALSRKASSLGLDLFHAPHYVLPIGMKMKSVVTIHDIIHLQDPAFGLAARAYARFMIRSAIKRSSAVLTVSEYTKKNLITEFNLSPGMIHVTLNGGGSDFAPLDDDSLKKAMGKLRLEPGYYLFVGSDRAHKNLNAVEKVLREMDEAARFVIVGRINDDNKRKYRQFDGRVTFFDNVRIDEMQALYTGALALLFPSYHEGFGLPPLEAMACGTPVVASNRSSIPEVVGASAILIDPDDAAGMAAALRKIRDDAIFRENLIAKGYHRAKQFSWEETARKTLAVYEEVAQ